MDRPVKPTHEIHNHKQQVYQKVNAYTHTPSIQQVVTLLLFLMQLALHSVFIVPTLNKIRIQLLWILFGFHYSLIIVIVYDYIYLTIQDPVDQLILHQELAVRYSQQDIKFCLICGSQVRKYSHHCNKCKRCTQNFDHHCNFLNNCIGSRNYESFFRLITIDQVYNLNMIGQSIWVLIINFSDGNLSFNGNKWGVLSLLIVSFIILVAVGILYCFHCYISCYKQTTTYKFLFPSQKSSSDNFDQININRQTLQSADRLGIKNHKIIV